MRRLASLFAIVLAACSSNSAPAAPSGPDAGAGCDSSIYAHCTFKDSILPGVGPVCIEYSGAFEDRSACRAFGDQLTSGPVGTYATGACPRDGSYDESCILPATAPADAGSCRAFQTWWGHSSEWNVDAGVPGLPYCMR